MKVRLPLLRSPLEWVAGFLLSFVFCGCGLERCGVQDISVAPLEKILVSGGRNHFLFEIDDESEFVIRTEKNVERCSLSDRVKSYWDSVRALSDGGEIEVDDELSWNPSPSRKWHGIVIIHIRELPDGTHVMRYVSGNCKTSSASKWLDKIFDACGLPSRVELYIHP